MGGSVNEAPATSLQADRSSQHTGFGNVIPTGLGLFAYNTMDEILEAFDAIQSDYEKHSAGARALAEEYFRAETVLARVLNDLGF